MGHRVGYGVGLRVAGGAHNGSISGRAATSVLVGGSVMVRHCPTCHAEFLLQDRFCAGCGKELDVTTGPPLSKTVGSSSGPQGLRRNVAIVGLLTAGAILLAVGIQQAIHRDARPTTAKRTPMPAPQSAPQRQSEGEQIKADLVGKVSVGQPDIPGWDYWGGAMMSSDRAWSQYQRSDGAALVLVQSATRATPDAFQSTFRVLDVVFIPRLEASETVAISCKGPGLSQGQVIAVAMPNHDEEWWTNVRSAWSVDPSGRVEPIGVDGVACANESAGGD